MPTNVNVPAGIGTQAFQHQADTSLNIQYATDTSTRCYNISMDETLIAASSAGHLDLVNWLLEVGANPNALDKVTLTTPLIAASRNGHASVVDLLCKRGAATESRDSRGMTSLAYAVLIGLPLVIQVLWQYEVSVNDVIQSDITLLDLAGFLGYADIVDMLINLGAAGFSNVSGKTILQTFTELRKGIHTISVLKEKQGSFNDYDHLHKNRMSVVHGYEKADTDNESRIRWRQETQSVKNSQIYYEDSDNKSKGALNQKGYITSIDDASKRNADVRIVDVSKRNTYMTPAVDKPERNTYITPAHEPGVETDPSGDDQHYYSEIVEDFEDYTSLATTNESLENERSMQSESRNDSESVSVSYPYSHCIDASSYNGDAGPNIGSSSQFSTHLRGRPGRKKAWIVQHDTPTHQQQKQRSLEHSPIIEKKVPVLPKSRTDSSSQRRQPCQEVKQLKPPPPPLPPKPPKFHMRTTVSDQALKTMSNLSFSKAQSRNTEERARSNQTGTINMVQSTGKSTQNESPEYLLHKASLDEVNLVTINSEQKEQLYWKAYGCSVPTSRRPKEPFESKLNTDTISSDLESCRPHQNKDSHGSTQPFPSLENKLNNVKPPAPHKVHVRAVRKCAGKTGSGNPITLPFDAIRPSSYPLEAKDDPRAQAPRPHTYPNYLSIIGTSEPSDIESFV